MPEDDRLRDIIDGFNAVWGFPQSVGAIDGTHIPILRPSGDSGSDYFNRKSFYHYHAGSGGLQRYFYVGWPGKVHDARDFSNSSIYAKAQQGTLLPNYFVFLVTLLIPPFPG